MLEVNVEIEVFINEKIQNKPQKINLVNFYC